MADTSSTLSSTTKSVKGQLANVGSAMSSAYGKAKTAITAPFTTSTASATPNATDAASLTGKSASLAPEIFVAQGNVFESQGNYAKAMDSYSKALEIEAKNSAALASMARLYDRQNDSAKAVEFYNKAIAVSPSAALYADLGNLHSRNQDLKSAKDQLQKAVNLDPKNKSYRSSLAGVLLDSGSPDAAFDELRQVETPAMANYQMAYLHFARKNVPATQQYLNNALQIDPNLKPARDLMASMGGTQAISNLAQSGQQFSNQAMGVYQQAGQLLSGTQAALGQTAGQVQSVPAGYMTPATAATAGAESNFVQGIQRLPNPNAVATPQTASAIVPGNTVMR